MALQRRERERLAREAEILSAAERLFITKGYENTTMDVIAKEAEFTKRTLYQYFTSKENLFYAVIINGVKVLLSYIDEAIDAGKTGFEKIRGTRSALYRFVKAYPDIYQLMNYTQFIKSDPEKIPNYQELNKLNSQLFSRFGQVVAEGMKDGSIRPDFNMPLGIFALFFLTTGFMGRITEVGPLYSARFSFDMEDLVKYTFDRMDDLIRTDER